MDGLVTPLCPQDTPNFKNIVTSFNDISIEPSGRSIYYTNGFFLATMILDDKIDEKERRAKPEETERPQKGPPGRQASRPPHQGEEERGERGEREESAASERATAGRPAGRLVALTMEKREEMREGGERRRAQREEI
jgi:hypothetical protein